MRVLFATTHAYLPQRTGGIESSTHELCGALARRGFEVAVMARLENRGLLALRNRLRRKLTRASSFPPDRSMGYPVHRGWNPVRGAADVVRDFAPSAVVVQGRGSAPLVRAFLERAVPTVFYLRDVEFHDLGATIPRDPNLLPLANSRFTARRAREELGLEPHVLPPLVHPEAYRTTSTRERAVFVNPHPVKGVDLAFRLAEARPDVPFLFVESWALRPALGEELRERAAGLPNVEWRGPVEDMREVYGRARLLLVPSRWEEAWGRIPTEGQVSGIPALASRRGGLPESVGPGGILVDPEAPFESWRVALSRMWDRPEEYEALAAAAAEHARREEIQPEVVASRFADLVREHARGRSPHRA